MATYILVYADGTNRCWDGDSIPEVRRTYHEWQQALPAHLRSSRVVRITRLEPPATPVREGPALAVLSKAEIIELVNLYHLAVGVAGHNRGDRMRQAARWFANEHSDVSQSSAYKQLERALIGEQA